MQVVLFLFAANLDFSPVICKDPLRQIDTKGKKKGSKRFKSQRIFVYLQHETSEYHIITYLFFSYPSLRRP